MITAIVYGRNDSHGYNLHRRVALSLNCIAEILGDPNDEIIFVDYNTPDDFITLPEAIADTLTPRCRKMLRILRVRPCIHALYAGRTDLAVLEPVARNIAIRRSHPGNRWLLLTNTDMVFRLDPKWKSLGALAATLQDGLYELPRFEIPDTLWNMVDRKDPQAAIAKFHEWGSRFHLNEIHEWFEETRYSEPGDFQLVPRQDLFDIDGFDEEHLLGWTHDTNICRRLFLKHGKTHTLESDMAGWHCSHTRAAAATHSSRRANSMQDMYYNVIRPDLLMQRAAWGLPQEVIEDITLFDAATHPLLEALEKLIREGRAQPYRYTFMPGDVKPCPPDHLAAFSADLLYSFPRAMHACYLGCDAEIFSVFRRVWLALGFTGDILIPKPRFRALAGEDSKAVREVAFDPTALLEQAGMVVADMRVFTDAVAEKDAIADNRRTLAVLDAVIKAEQQRILDKQNVPRKIAVLNGCQGMAIALLQGTTNMQASPFTTRIRHGIAVPPKKSGA